MPTLYRKYRPQTFADLIGQEHVSKTIAAAVALNKVAHAYLFSGPRGVGKTTVARLLAKAINCPNRPTGTAEPCNTCPSCTEITQSRNIDVMEIDAASHTGVDNVRENIIDNAQFRPTQSPFKIFIIDEVHMLSASAFNALLKTLEEPPAHVIFILATTETHKLPATILSRCQHFNFNKISTDNMLKRLKKLTTAETIEVDEEVLQRIARKSEGCVRDAESLLGQILSLGLKKITADDANPILPAPQPEKILSLLKAISDNNAPLGLNIITEQINVGVNWEQFADEIAEILRLVLIAQTGYEPEELLNYKTEARQKIKQIGVLIKNEKLIRITEKIMERRQEIKNSVLPQLPLELWLLEAINIQNDHCSVTTNSSQNDNLPSTTLIADPETTAVVPPPTVGNIAQTIKTVISNFTHSNKPPTVDLITVQEKWPDLIRLLDGDNHSLTFILKICQLESISERGLEISLPYSFHQAKIEDRKNKKIIEDALEKILGEKINLICTVKEEHTQKTDDLNGIVAGFGGEIIE